jgi:hypothetical protein
VIESFSIVRLHIAAHLPESTKTHARNFLPLILEHKPRENGKIMDIAETHQH